MGSANGGVVDGPTIRVMGRRVRPLERISKVGELIGLNRSAAYRQSHTWPLVGPETSRYVVVERLLSDLGISYEFEQEQGATDSRETRSETPHA